MPKDKMLRVRLDSDDFNAFKMWAKSLDLTMSEYVRLTIEELIKNGYKADSEGNPKSIEVSLLKESDNNE